MTHIEGDCTCTYGCPNCGYALAAMGNCPAWDPCPVGREPNPTCPVHAKDDQKRVKT